MKFFILIDLFKFYFKFKLIPLIKVKIETLMSKLRLLRSKLINIQKIKKREKTYETVTHAD